MSPLHLRTVFKTQGELITCYVSALVEIYSIRGQTPNPWVLGMIERLKKIFLSLGDMFLLIKSSSGDLGTPANYNVTCKALLESAKDLIRELDCDLISKVHGKSVAGTFRRSMALDSSRFADSSGEALTAAKKARPESGGGNAWQQQVYHDVDATPVAAGATDGVLPAPAPTFFRGRGFGRGGRGGRRGRGRGWY